MTAADDAGGEVGMARLALELEAAVAAGGDHRRGELVVAERALPVDLIRGWRRTAVLRGAMIAARGEQRRQAERRNGAGRSHRSAP